MNITRREFIQQSALGLGALGTGVFAGCAQAQNNNQNANLPQLAMGMNLSGIADWEPGFPFLNLMWGARLWLTKNADLQGPWNTEQIEKIALDENGYPLELPLKVDGADKAQIVFTLLPNVRTAGEYVLLYDGEGEFAGVMNTKVVDVKPGRVLLSMKMQANSLEGIYITRSQKGNHVRNIRIVPLAQEKADLTKNPFLPEFLDFCRPFHALRFMDWATTNASLEREWKDRKKSTFYTMVGTGGDADKFYGKGVNASQFLLSGGVALELMLQLANELKIDPWVCVPHRATDEYIVELAKLVKDKLDPQRKVYLEYSNEVWNWGFMQAQWMLRSEVAAAPLEAKGLNPCSPVAHSS